MIQRWCYLKKKQPKVRFPKKNLTRQYLGRNTWERPNPSADETPRFEIHIGWQNLLVVPADLACFPLRHHLHSQLNAGVAPFNNRTWLLFLLVHAYIYHVLNKTYNKNTATRTHLRTSVIGVPFDQKMKIEIPQPGVLNLKWTIVRMQLPLVLLVVTDFEQRKLFHSFLRIVAVEKDLNQLVHGRPFRD